MWEQILYPPLFVKVIDYGLIFLFNWKTKNISASQKLAAYPHLYSFTSTKSVVHWFQIIRTKSFQMYDDDPPLSIATSTSKFTKVAKYPTRNIKTPIVLVYGGSDSLVDIKAMLRELPKTTVATEIPHYEHLDFLWGRDNDVQVFPHVFDALDSFTDAEHTKDEYTRYRMARHHSLNASSSWRKHVSNESDVALSDANSTNGDLPPLQHQAREGPLRVQFSDDESSRTTDGSPTGAKARSGGYDSAQDSGQQSPSRSLTFKSSGGNLRNMITVGKGISLGASRAVGGLSTSAVVVPGSQSPDEGRGSERRKGSLGDINR